MKLIHEKRGNLGYEKKGLLGLSAKILTVRYDNMVNRVFCQNKFCPLSIEGQMLALHRWALPIYLLCITTALLWVLRGSLTVANFTMIYIFVILIIAIQRGTQIAVVSSFVSFLCINFFLIHPYYTLIVADPREVLDLIVFFMVSVLVGQLAAYARKQAGFEEADRLKTALLYAIAHDLRTPITILKTSTSNLHTLDERLSHSERQELIQTIADEIDELDKLIGNLLNLSRLRVGA